MVSNRGAARGGASFIITGAASARQKPDVPADFRELAKKIFRCSGPMENDARNSGKPIPLS